MPLKMKWHARIEVQYYSIPDSKTMCTFRKKKKKLLRLWGNFYERPMSRRVTISFSDASLNIGLIWRNYDVLSGRQILFGTRCMQWNLAIVMSSAAHFSVKYGHTNWNRMQQGGQKAKK